MKGNSILFLSYWYPNKINRIFPVFIKKHAQCISLENNIVVLSLSIIKEPVVYKKSVEVIIDEHGIETHQVYIASQFYKLIYMSLPLHYLVLKNYIRKVLLTKHSFSIIHSNILFPCAIVGSSLAKHFQFKHVITEHWSRLDSFFKSNIYKFSGRKTLKNADAITCVSGLLKTTVEKYTKNRNIYVVPNVIDEKEYYLDSTVQKKENFSFIAAANWTPPKYPFSFLDALEEIYRSGAIKDFELTLAGNGTQLEEVKKRNYSFRIFYPGILNSKELRKALNESDIFLHGSNYETFSTIIVEALRCGIPCVVSPVGIAADVVNPQNGLIANNTREDWVKKIMQCYSTDYDRGKIASSLRGRFGLESTGADFSKVYTTLH